MQLWALNEPCTQTRQDRGWSSALIRDFEECFIGRLYSSEGPARHREFPPILAHFIERLKTLESIHEDAVIDFMVYEWQRLSGIGLHPDLHCDLAVSYYVHDHWDPNWGGDNVYYDSPELAQQTRRSIFPRPPRRQPAQFESELENIEKYDFN